MVGWPDRRFLDLVGVEHPIIQAPMAGCRRRRPVRWRSAGGRVGITALRDDLRREAPRPGSRPAATDRCADQSQFLLPRNAAARRRPRMAQSACGPTTRSSAFPSLRLRRSGSPSMRPIATIVEELKPEVVSFHFGLPASAFARARSGKRRGNPRQRDERSQKRNVSRAARRRCDHRAGLSRREAIAGRFLDAGSGEALGLFALLPQLLNSVSVPVIAAGGIADGRGIAAALMLGASAVQIGTAYLHCPECFLPDGHKAMLRKRRTLMTNIYSGGLARAVRGTAHR